FYYCDTSLRVEPYRYYRLHAWRAWHQELDFLGMYKYMTGPGGHFGRGSWKATPNGGLAYNASNEPVSSIRLEVLREGMDDIKYLHVLKQTLDALPADRAASALAKEARAFLEAQ